MPFTVNIKEQARIGVGEADGLGEAEGLGDGVTNLANILT